MREKEEKSGISHFAKDHRKINGEDELPVNKCGCRSPILLHENPQMYETLGIYGLSHIQTQCRACKTTLGMVLRVDPKKGIGIEPGSPVEQLFLGLLERAIANSQEPSGIVIAR